MNDKLTATSAASIPKDRLVDFCRRWKVAELSLFGSALREDFRPDSDVDLLVSFAPGVTRDFDDLLTMKEELQTLFGRAVDLVERRLVEDERELHPAQAHPESLEAPVCGGMRRGCSTCGRPVEKRSSTWRVSASIVFM